MPDDASGLRRALRETSEDAVKPEDLLVLFEDNAKYLEKETSIIEDLPSMQGPVQPGVRPIGSLTPNMAWMGMRKRYGRKSVFKFWESIEGVLDRRGSGQAGGSCPPPHKT